MEEFVWELPSTPIWRGTKNIPKPATITSGCRCQKPEFGHPARKAVYLY